MRTSILLLYSLAVIMANYACQKVTPPNSAFGQEELAAAGGKGKGGGGGGKAAQNTMTDVDGNVYKTVKIGKQVWMAENLKVTRYRDSSSIVPVVDQAVWSAAGEEKYGAWCYYQNDSSTYNSTYGKLYNWYTVNDARKLAPTGWHIPDSAEWYTLFNTLQGIFLAGQPMKNTTGWDAFTGIANTNTSGFSAYPGGFRIRNLNSGKPDFDYIGKQGFFWSSTQASNLLDAYRCSLAYDVDRAYLEVVGKGTGFSVRCIKD